MTYTLGDLNALAGEGDYAAIMGARSFAPTIGGSYAPSSMGSGMMGGGINPNALGLNLDTGKMAIQGIATLGSLYAAFKQLGLAKKQFKYEKNVTDTNLSNQIQSYNTSLADRARARAVTEGRPQSEADAYVAANKAVRTSM